MWSVEWQLGQKGSSAKPTEVRLCWIWKRVVTSGRPRLLLGLLEGVAMNTLLSRHLFAHVAGAGDWWVLEVNSVTLDFWRAMACSGLLHLCHILDSPVVFPICPPFQSSAWLVHLSPNDAGSRGQQCEVVSVRHHV